MGGAVVRGLGVGALLVVLLAVAGTRTPTPGTSTPVDLPTAGATPLPTTTEAVAPRCRLGGRATACSLWDRPAAVDVLPVVAGGRVVVPEGDGLAAWLLDDGTPAWRTGALTDLIWLYAGPEDARWLLAVDGTRRLHVVEAATGRVALALDGVRPVFPGVVEDRIAVVRDRVTEVHLLEVGASPDADPTPALLVDDDGPRSRTRLVPGGVVSWVGHVLEFREGRPPASDPAWTVAVGDDVTDVAGDADLLVAVRADGSATAVDVASRSVAWTTEPGTADATYPLLLDDAVALAGNEDGAGVRVLARDDGRVLASAGVDDAYTLHAVGADAVLVVDDVGRGLVRLRGVGPDLDWLLHVAGGERDVAVGGGRALVGGAAGAVLVDLATGTRRWGFGEGPSAAISAGSPVVLDDDVLHRVRASLAVSP